MRKCHLILTQIVNWWNFNSSMLGRDASCVSNGVRRPSGHLSTPVISDSAASASLPPNYKQGMFVSGSSQVTVALGACLAVKSGPLSAFVIDVSGSEVTARSNMNMERFELSDGRWALTTSADKINWKQLPTGVWTEHIMCFLFFGSVLHLHPLTLLQSQVISRDVGGGGRKVYAISGSTMYHVNKSKFNITWVAWLWLQCDCTELDSNLVFKKEKFFSSHRKLQTLWEIK